MRTNIHSLISVLAALLLMATVSCGRKKTDLQGAVITALAGRVSLVDGQGKERIVSTGDLYTKAGLFTPGMTLLTDTDGHADLQFTTGLVMRVNGCSRMKLEKASILIDADYRHVVMQLQSGGVFTRSEKLSGNSDIVVSAPTSIASVRGTEFLVREGCPGMKRSETLVREGSVLLTDSSGAASDTISAGGKGSIGPGGIIRSEMSDSDKKEIADAGQDIRPVSEEGRSRVDKILEDFEENTRLFRQAIEEMKSSSPPEQRSAPPAESRSPSSPQTGVPLSLSPPTAAASSTSPEKPSEAPAPAQAPAQAAPAPQKPAGNSGSDSAPMF